MRGCVIWIALALLVGLAWLMLSGGLQPVVDFLHGLATAMLPTG